MKRRALIVVAKRPEPGRTKTRLAPPLTQEEASELYRCFLLDTLALMARVEGVERVIAYAPRTASSYFCRIICDGFWLVPQVGPTLAQRLHQVLTRHLTAGYDQAVVMNSDGPTLPADYLSRAFGHLDDPATDVVLGPSEDGGYYLIGLKQPCAALFNVQMSTDTVLRETLEQARQLGLRSACLDPWYDIDTREDLQRLIRELPSLPEEVAPCTRRFLALWAGGRSDHEREG